MRAIAPAVVVALPLLLGGCPPAPQPARIHFAQLPEGSGFRFRHELPGGRLDSLAKAAMGGIAVLDYDGDGDLDIYCINGGWHPKFARVPRPEKVARNRLFRNLGNLKFEDVTDAAGVGDEGFGMGACVGDYDNDGHVDLLVCNFGRSVLYRNRGDGTFEDATDAAGIAPGFHIGAAFLDYDRDGVLDLYIAQYVDPDLLLQSVVIPADSPQVLPPVAYRPQRDSLYRGRGDGTFEDVSRQAGVTAEGRGMSVLATDLDGDTFIDIYVANDGQENFAYINQGDGTFKERAAVLGLAFGMEGGQRASMGITAADLDADGRLDYLVPDTQGGAVYASEDRYFRERASDLALKALAERQTGWADVVLDADNDGTFEIYKTHGHLNSLTPQPSQLFVRGADGKYAAPLGAAIGLLEIVARGGVAADLDNDGLEDLVVQELNGLAVVLHNRSTGTGHWARLRLVGKQSNRMALGARVLVKVGERTHVREVSGSVGYASAGDTRLHIGLGTADEIDSIVVLWPSGGRQEFGSFDEVDREIVLREK